jgi:beta-glucosidase
MSGRVNPSAKLAITFPQSDADLPHPTITLPPPASDLNRAVAGGDISNFMSIAAKGLPAFQTTYDERLEVGYAWYDAKDKAVLFPFGFGLSYTKFVYSGLSVHKDKSLVVQFTVSNVGKRAGTEIAQVYAALPKNAYEPPRRLVGWARIDLAAGASRTITLELPDDRLAIFDEIANTWRLVPGEYSVSVGGSSRSLPLKQILTIR